MSAPTPPPTYSAEREAEPRRKAGCAKGCLFGCLTPIIALLIGLLVARPTLEEKWARFRADNPWVAHLPGAIGIAKDVAGGLRANKDTASADTAGGRSRSAKRLKGVDDKSAIPADLPLWPKPKGETFSVGEGHAAAYQRVAIPSDSVLRYFRRTMPTRGWRLDQERTGAGGVLLVYRKGNRIARVEVVADSAGSDIWLRSRSAVQASGR